ncbi:U6 small nuclear RNA (adenine-(43)-N(6))-methyltransferase [Microplitis mediator]|uniref:U6 small nuclear RNA (adenine-(43)-N(6))-methyltransferase n=1 Tax=Microplitis mediator TaxID=375433 RepID=UPI0025543E23|nr:U6 small nuclear RNA (adenine-(43)-N(6))-methyltransferase [Microplitis mediator]
MSLKKFIHPRNKYKVPPNFKQLADLYPEFQQHVSVNLSGKLQFNFNNRESLAVLTKTLLKHDFDLDVNIPTEKLVPALTLRLNYILWIEDLMNFSGISQVSGIDIGTGAIGIYSLLCAKINNWKMIGTDIDALSVSSAVENIQRNKLDHLIKVIRVQNNVLLKGIMTDEESYSFTMCNPPFFDDDNTEKKEKRLPPTNAKTGHDIELSVTGGEKFFVSQMIDASIELKEKIKIYTTMLGQKSSLAYCKSELRKKNIYNFTWTEFCQGNTKRWGLAWSLIPKDELDLSKAPVIRMKESNTDKSKDYFSTELLFPFNNKFKTINDVTTGLKQWINELQIEIKELKLEDFNGSMYELCAYKNNWVHARRKRRMEMQLNSVEYKRPRVDDKDQPSTANDFQESSTIDSTKSDNKIYLKFNLAVSNSLNEDDSDNNNGVKISMILNEGEGGKNALESFKQCLLNKFSIREFQKQNKQIVKKLPKKRKKN